MQERLRKLERKNRRPFHFLLWPAFVLFLSVAPAALQIIPETYTAEKARLPASLRQWEKIGALPSTAVLRTFKQGTDHFFAGRYEAALKTLPGENEAPAIGDYILFYRAKSNLALRRDGEALSGFRKLEQQYPDSPMLRESLMEQCRILLERKEAKAVLAILDNPKAATTSETTYYQAMALELLGEKQKAADLLLRIYSHYPTSKHSASAEKRLASLSPGALKGARNYAARLERAENLVRAGQYTSAKPLLLALGQVSAPDSASSQKRNLLLGEVEYCTGRSSAAIPYLRKVTAAHPELHARALYLEGACARRLEREQDMVALRDKAVKLYPKFPATEELCYSVATYYDVKYRSSSSREAYSILYKTFPKGTYAERSLWKLSMFSYLEKRFDAAAAGFWEYVRSFSSPLSAGPAMYWMGRCYERLNGPDNARYLYRRARLLLNESYYGRLAHEAERALEKSGKKGRAEIPEIDFSRVTAACDAIQLPPPALAEPDADPARVISRAAQLISVGLSDLALTELRWGRNQYPEADEALCYVMARIYTEKQDYNSAISTLRRGFPNYLGQPTESLPDEIWNIFFPVRHLGIISRHASQRNIDPALVLGLIRQESGFKETARSKANARGLMQILPSTGRTLARQSPRITYSLERLYQPETNIALGTRFLSSLLKQLEKPELALAAYNAGKSRVDRWLEEWGDLDMAEFVEQIPFSETRGYVKQVLSNQARYALLTSSAQP